MLARVGHRHEGRRDALGDLFHAGDRTSSSASCWSGWSTGTGESSSSLKALLMTFNRDKGYGTANRGRYSNGKVDALTEDALAIVDDAKREAMLQRATELAINDTGIVPLHFQVNLWATRDGITYVPRTDENTLAWKFVPAKQPMNANIWRKRWRSFAAPACSHHAACFIDNRWVAAATGATLPMIDPSGRVAVRGDRRGSGPGHRSRGRGGAARARRRVGRLAPAEKGRLLPSSRARSSTSADELALDRGARLRQADEAGARRRHRVRALLRVLRRRVRQAARRDDSVLRRATRC